MAALLAVCLFAILCITHSIPYEIENYKDNLGNFRMPPFVFAVAHSEMIKDLENLKDLVNDYKTIPIVYGEEENNHSINLLTVLPVYLLIEIYDVGYMDIYFVPL
jgi:4-hydroxybenzoate polyprenyltransferase